MGKGADNFGSRKIHGLAKPALQPLKRGGSSVASCFHPGRTGDLALAPPGGGTAGGASGGVASENH